MTKTYVKIIRYICFILLAAALSVALVWVVKSEIIPFINLSAPAREEFEIKTDDEILDDLLDEGDVSAVIQNEYEKYMESLPKVGSGFAEGYVKGQTMLVHADKYSNTALTPNRGMPAYTGDASIPSGYVCEGCENGVLMLSRNGKYGYYSETGYWLTAPDYDEAYAFVGGLAVVKKGTLYGVIDTDGETVIPFLFDGIGDAEAGGITVYKKGEGHSRIAFVTTGQNN